VVDWWRIVREEVTGGLGGGGGGGLVFVSFALSTFLPAVICSFFIKN